MFEGFSRCQTIVVFGRRRIHANCDLGFAATNNQITGPVRVECGFTSLRFEIAWIAVGQRRSSASGTAYVVG